MSWAWREQSKLESGTIMCAIFAFLRITFVLYELLVDDTLWSLMLPPVIIWIEPQKLQAIAAGLFFFLTHLVENERHRPCVDLEIVRLPSFKFRRHVPFCAGVPVITRVVHRNVDR